MNDEPESKTLDRTDVTAEQLESIANQIATFHAAYAKAAADMRSEKIQTLPLKGMINLMNWMKRMNGAMQSLQSAIMEARLDELKPRKSTASAVIERNEAVQKSDAMLKKSIKRDEFANKQRDGKSSRKKRPDVE